MSLKCFGCLILLALTIAAVSIAAFCFRLRTEMTAYAFVRRVNTRTQHVFLDSPVCIELSTRRPIEGEIAFLRSELTPQGIVAGGTLVFGGSPKERVINAHAAELRDLSDSFRTGLDVRIQPMTRVIIGSHVGAVGQLRSGMLVKVSGLLQNGKVNADHVRVFSGTVDDASGMFRGLNILKSK